LSTGESHKIDEMRCLARRLREYSVRRSFAAYAESMARVAKELDYCADKVAARDAVFQ
jgi:hypothetical protein